MYIHMYIHIDIRTYVGADDRTIQLKTGQDTAEGEWTRQGRAEQDRTGADSTGQATSDGRSLLALKRKRKHVNSTLNCDILMIH